MKKILGCIKRAQSEFNMINNGDVIGVGVSGGKDSLTLLKALRLYQNFAPVSFTLKAITIDMGFEGFDVKGIEKYCLEQDAEFILEKTQMGKVIFEDRKESNPCSFCSRMRRGLLNKICEREGITKLALGHHGDDLIESFLMSMTFESRLSSFKPVTHFERTDVIQIRPMIYACEKDVVEACERHEIKTFTNPCPASGFTQRQNAKELTAIIEEKTGQPREHIINAICRSSII